MEIFSKRLKWVRENKGLTQKEVAEAIGVSQQYYGRFEKGQAQPNLEALSKLPGLLNEDLHFLLGLSDLDYRGDKLFSAYWGTKKENDKYKDTLNELIEIIDDEIEDQVVEDKLRSILNKSATSSKSLLEKSFQGLINYLGTVPGVPEDRLTREYFDYVIEYYEELEDNTKYDVDLIYSNYLDYKDISNPIEPTMKSEVYIANVIKSGKKIEQ